MMSALAARSPAGFPEENVANFASGTDLVAISMRVARGSKLTAKCAHGASSVCGCNPIARCAPLHAVCGPCRPRLQASR